MFGEWSDAQLTYLSALVEVAYGEGIGTSGDGEVDLSVERELVKEMARRGMEEPWWVMRWTPPNFDYTRLQRAAD